MYTDHNKLIEKCGHLIVQNQETHTLYTPYDHHRSPLYRVKSDRINALRKQYDAFLEEDKRRRERNEYILGWLDRLRTCPTVSPIRIQENSFEANHNRTLTGSNNIVKYKAPAFRPANIKLTSIDSFDESLILKEVSKKYILIPKNAPEIENNCNVYGEDNIQGTENSLDWKNKYNILDELKQKEKEEHCDFVNKDNVSLGDVPVKNRITRENKSPIDLSNKNKDEYIEENKKFETNSYNVPDPSLTNNVEIYQNDQVEKDINFDVNYNTITPQNDLSKQHYDLETKMLQNSLERKPMNNVQYTDLKLQIKENQVNNKDLPQNVIENNDHDANNTFYEELPQNTTENPAESNYTTSIKTNITPIEFSELAIDNTVFEKQKLENQENINTNNEEMNIVESSPDTKNSALYEVNSEQPVDSEPTNLIDNSNENAEIQIQEFETEQKELFYSEDPNQNYTYNNEEHVASNEDYGNNEQYSYYEATKEDTNQYAPEINEHEESTEKYDPHYENQYVNSYEGNPTQNDYPADEYAQNQNLEYVQQQFYENYEHQQLDNNITTEQQEYEDTMYNTSDIEHQENTADTHKYDLSPEQMTPSKTEIQLEDQQINNENPIDETTVAYNEDIPASEYTPEEQNTNLK